VCKHQRGIRQPSLIIIVIGVKLKEGESKLKTKPLSVFAINFGKRIFWVTGKREKYNSIRIQFSFPFSRK
jgi:hypothetical protein